MGQTRGLKGQKRRLKGLEQRAYGVGRESLKGWKTRHKGWFRRHKGSEEKAWRVWREGMKGQKRRHKSWKRRHERSVGECVKGQQESCRQQTTTKMPQHSCPTTTWPNVAPSAGHGSSVTAVVPPAERLQAEPWALAGGSQAQASGEAEGRGEACWRGTGREQEQRQTGEHALLTHTLLHNLVLFFWIWHNWRCLFFSFFSPGIIDILKVIIYGHVHK